MGRWVGKRAVKLMLAASLSVAKQGAAGFVDSTTFIILFFPLVFFSVLHSESVCRAGRRQRRGAAV